jgi:hypothetical protein
MESPTLRIEDTENMHNTNMLAPLEKSAVAHKSLLATDHDPHVE